MSEQMLELRSIDKRLGSLDLSGISLTITKGECLVLLGPSGVGKTVLLEIIAGLSRPDAGSILWDGQDIAAAPPEARGFALVYQDYALFPHLTVAQNIRYGLRASGAKSQAMREKVQDLARVLHITDILGRRPSMLSGGEQQRVALARALASNPRLLLLDEPLSALDRNTRLTLRKELKRMRKRLGVPILHVTHDPEEAMELGDRVCVMLDNRIRQMGSPEELFRRPSDPDVAEFLGIWNILPVTEVRDGSCSICGMQIHANAADDSTSYIWIKPEEILLSLTPFASSARNQFKCKVVEWDHRDSLLAVRLASGELNLTALITYASFEALAVATDTELYVTFKSSAIHCF
jgi:molybdate/tungstate transport system ATP-binding protein